MGNRLRGLDAHAQLDAWEHVATDPRPRIQSGWPRVDALLHRGGIAPGTFCILAGRMHTRKTAVALNITANLLHSNVAVGVVALDEAPFMYSAKLLSAATGRSHSELEREFGTPEETILSKEYFALTEQRLSITDGQRPTWDAMDEWLELCELEGNRPRVVVIDYLSLLHRGQYDGAEQGRIPRLAENLRVWTQRNEVVTVALHQIGRSSDDAKRYHGHTPMTPEHLMHGGEQAADIIFGTYRPAMDPLGNMSWEQAEAEDVERGIWERHVTRVQAHAQDTYLQLVKNRPGTSLDHQGIRLRSVGDSQRMEVTI